MKILDKMSRKILGISYLILIVMMILRCWVGFIYPDIWWQLKEGTYILYNLKFPQLPLNAFGFANAPFPHEYAFYEIFIASVRCIFGFFGLRIFFFVAAFFPFAYALGWVAKKRQWNFANFYLLSFAYFLLIFRIQQRPEILANVFFIFILHLLFVKDFRSSPYFLIMLYGQTPMRLSSSVLSQSSSGYSTTSVFITKYFSTRKNRISEFRRQSLQSLWRRLSSRTSPNSNPPRGLN